jgi:hypothetical protein
MYILLTYACMISMRIDVGQTSPLPQGSTTSDADKNVADNLQNGIYTSSTKVELKGNERIQALEKFRQSLAVKKNADGTLDVGGVCVDIAKRQLSFPAHLNMNAGEIEYAIATERSEKKHETLFITSIDPDHIHLSALLLGLLERPLMLRYDKSWDRQMLEISIAWQKDGAEQKTAINDCILLGQVAENVGLSSGQGQAPADATTLKGAFWPYNGSYFSTKGFVAHIDGLILAIQRDPSALVSPHFSIKSTFAFYPNAALLPPQNTPVQVIFKLAPLVKVPRTETHTP